METTEITLEDLNQGLFYYNFIVKDGVPKILVEIGKETDLVTTQKFLEANKQISDKLNKNGKTILIGSRGIGKSTLVVYTAWRLLLDKQIDTVIHVNSLKPTDAPHLENEIKYTSKKYLLIYDPSPIQVYYKPDTMQNIKYNITDMKDTLKQLMRIRNAWVITVLPNEFYEIINNEPILDMNSIINVNLKDEEFLKEVIKKYSGCDNISDDLVKSAMRFDTYTLIARHIGIWFQDRECKVEDVNKALTESIDTIKLFYATYIWSTILKGSIDLAKKVSVPLILHANFGSIPEEITYITKGVNKEGVWQLINRETIAKEGLESLEEDELKPIAKWLSIKHEDLIEETLQELVGLRGEEARKKYIEHGFKNLIRSLEWGYEKILEELNNGVNTKNVKDNLSIFIKERLSITNRFSS